MSPAKQNPKGLKLYGPGDFYNPNVSVDLTAWSVRMEFVHAVKNLAPDVLEGLRDDVWPIFVDFSKDPPSKSLLGWLHFWSKIDNFRFGAELRAALRGWAESYSIAVDWVLYLGFQTLSHWQAHPTAKDQLNWFFPELEEDEPVTSEEAKFSFAVLGWHPTYQPWPEYEREIKDAFNTSLEKYRDRIMNLAKERGWRKAPQRLFHHDFPSRHMEWVVRYQVQGWSHADIADYYDRLEPSGRGLSESAVSKAIKKLTDLIGLKVRPKSRGGRPRKE